jgi:DNA-binding transcriptional MerR regulator
MEAVPDEMTIDELAQLVGLPSSTIRLYRTRGLLPAPTRRGRAAFFGPGHVSRVDLIGRLQQRGFSLASIAELVQQWEDGRSLDEILGLEQRIPGAGHLPARLKLAPAELAAHFPSVDLTPGLMSQVLAMGLVELDDEGMVVIGSPELLEVGAALVALGFPLSEVLDEAATLQAEMAQVAERFAAMFERHVWRPFTDAGKPGIDLARVTAVLEQLRPLADRVVHATLREALATTANRFLAAEATLDTPTNDPPVQPTPEQPVR